MTTLNLPFLTAIHADESAAALPALSEGLLVRATSMIYELIRRAPQEAVLEAAAAGSDVALVTAIARLVMTESSPPDARTAALLQGQLALAGCLAASGGAWNAEEATTHLGVSRQALQQWRAQRRLLALPRAGNSFLYPVAQFRRPTSDTGTLRPYAVIQQIGQIVGDSLGAEELIALLATPQEALAGIDGTPRTPFAAIAAGEDARVLELVRWVVTPTDEGAPSARAVTE